MLLRRNYANAYATATMLAALCLCSVGCRLPNRVMLDDNGRPDYQTAMISYELDGTQRQLPLGDGEATEVKTVGYTVDGTAPPLQPKVESESIWKTARLSIEYPHPELQLGMARATLRLSAHVGTGGTASLSEDKPSLADQLLDKFGWDSNDSALELCNDELWVLDLPKSQLDQFLTDLSSDGFFEADLSYETAANLEVDADFGRTSKNWAPQPKLDQLITQVYREGRLRGFVPCQQAAAPCPIKAALPVIAGK
jgi:hypothetical protein